MRTDNPPLPLLQSLTDELAEKKRQVAHYARLTTTLELQLETIDRQQQKCIRRIEELAGEIEGEEIRLSTAESITPTRRRAAAEAAAV